MEKHENIPFIIKGMVNSSLGLKIECVDGLSRGARCSGTSSTTIPYALMWFGHIKVFLTLSPMYRACPRINIVVVPVLGSSIAVAAVTIGMFSMVSSSSEYADTFTT